MYRVTPPTPEIESLASTVTVIIPETIAPDAGDVIETTGGTGSKTINILKGLKLLLIELRL